MDKKQAVQKPPYGSFKTSRAFIERLRKTVVPDHIDRSMMTGLSGDAQTETLSGFRFLKLLGEKDSSQPLLRELVDTFGTDRWYSTLFKIVDAAYAPIIGDLNIETASARMLADRFRAYGVDGFMLPRCIRFYVSALKDCRVTFSPHFKAPTVKKTRTASSRLKGEEPLSENGENSDTTVAPPGYAVIPLPPDRKFIFPTDINAADVTMIAAVLNAYAARRDNS